PTPINGVGTLMRGSTLLQIEKTTCGFIIWFENANHNNRYQAYTFPDSLQKVSLRPFFSSPIQFPY
ncbi:hypothetical protein, partial [Lacticaseibacillus paracasei]|uniref:hypothetical protein n=1 Tax=Lacticaseibacillus paracasei TaxID=1597 RepID=UPI001CDC069F